jgi:hypothetical protein
MFPRALLWAGMRYPVGTYSIRLEIAPETHAIFAQKHGCTFPCSFHGNNGLHDIAAQRMPALRISNLRFQKARQITEIWGQLENSA